MGIFHRGRLSVAVVVAGFALFITGCASGGHSAPKPTLNATEQAELKQGQELLASCFPKALTQQIRTVHLVFLSSASGKNGAAVEAARTKLLHCLNIDDPAKRQAFIDKAGQDALHGHLTTHEGRHVYFTVTLPKDILAAGGHAGGVSGPTGTIPGVTGPATPRGTPSAAGSTS